jgi:hypothetical protein
VPVEVGTQRAAVTGSLFWVPSSGGGIPTIALVALVVLLTLTVVLFVATRRVRARTG